MRRRTITALIALVLLATGAVFGVAATHPPPARAAATTDSGFAEHIAGFVLPGRLTGLGLLVVSAPDVPDATRLQIERRLQQAGALIVTDVRVEPAWLRSANLLTALAGRLGAADAATELASVLTTRVGARPATASRRALSLAVFQQGRLLTVLSGGQTPAAAAVVLEGNDHPEMDAWARALDASSTGAVLAALGTPGKVATTVAQAGTPAGEIVVVLAMQARAHGQTGNYGPGVLPTLG